MQKATMEWVFFVFQDIFYARTEHTGYQILAHARIYAHPLSPKLLFGGFIFDLILHRSVGLASLCLTMETMLGLLPSPKVLPPKLYVFPLDVFAPPVNGSIRMRDAPGQRPRRVAEDLRPSDVRSNEDLRL